MSENPKKKDILEESENNGLSGGAIAGLVIGIILLIIFIVFLVLWYLRFRHYWASRKHTKMSNHVSDSAIPGGAHNNPYMSDAPIDGPVVSPGSSGTGPIKRTVNYPETWWPSDSHPVPSYSPQPTPYPLSMAPWPEVNEAPIEPTRIAMAYRESHAQTAAPITYPGMHSIFAFDHTGDLSQTAPGAISSLYPQLRSSLTSGEEHTTTTTTTTGSNSKQTSGRNVSQRVRSKVRMAARVSQLSMFNLRGRRRTSTRIHEGGRAKRRRGTRTGSVTIGSTTVMDYPGFPIASGEGYHNMNVISDDFEFDELGSLDNDEFLCSLEQAVFPGLEWSQFTTNSGNQTYRSPHSSMKNNHFHALNMSPNVVYPVSNYQNLTGADLSLGETQGSITGWRPLLPESDLSSSSKASQPSGFRFPAPGPPVSGWAHQLAQLNRQVETKSSEVLDTGIPTQTTPSVPSDTLGETVTAVVAPVIQPPPEVNSAGSLNRSTTSAQASASLSAAIPRRRAQKLVKARQQSEPRATGSRVTRNDQNDAFQHTDAASDESASD